MSDEADVANDSAELFKNIAIAKALEESRLTVEAEPDECLYCEENPRPMIIGPTGHPHRAANCARCMEELGMEYQLA